jgi:soluble lytic murein transglycosylase
VEPSAPEAPATPAAPTPPPPAEAASEPEPVEVEFPQDQLHSHFALGLSARALERHRRQEYALAEAAANSAMAQASDEQKRNLEILLAVIERDQEKWAPAAARFAAAAKGDPIIADYLHFQAARAYARAGDPAAEVHASKVDPQSPWAADMELLLAEVFRAKGNASQAIVHYQNYLAADGEGRLLDEARFRLGEMLRAEGKLPEAKEAWHKLVISDPVSSWAERARKEEPSLEKKLSAQDLMERGMGYFHAMRNLKSEADFADALKRKDLSPEERCQALFHRAKSVYKERSYKRAAPLFVPAIAACHASGNTNYEVKSAYQAGLAYSRARKRELSAKYYAHVEKYPEHSYADDARLRQGEEFDDLGEDEKVTELLSTLPADYPQGDMRGEAMWRLARRSYQRKDYEAAIGWLEEQIKVVPIEVNWWAEGQAHYWLGRSLRHLDRKIEAADAYAECIRRYPLTYYSMQAFNRLRQEWPERYQEMVAEVKKGASPWSNKPKARAVYGSAEFRSALRLARLGLSEPARRQLATLGFAAPPGRKAVTDPDRLDWLVAATRLLDLAGDYSSSHWIGRWHTVDYRRAWPNGDNALRWRLAYPLAYWELLQEFAAQYTYPPHLQMAIVREESAFDPARESWANAIGLTQMIFPTAIDHSKESGIAVTRENLQHPVKNVTIGSHFLESLQQAFDGRVGLMVPGYNAGRARVRGWIRSRHRYDLDEFIERIRGDQARRYTKRVLGSFFTYRYLGDGTIPKVRNQVPKRLGRL